jgi:predicted deacetylase
MSDSLQVAHQNIENKLEKEVKKWKEFYSEIHIDLNEIVFWILLYEDSNVIEAHREFCKTLQKRTKDLSSLVIHVTYYFYEDEQGYYYNTLKGEEAIFSAIENGFLGKKRYSIESENILVFNANNSKREI